MRSRVKHVIFCLIAPAIFASSSFAAIYVDQNASGPGHDGATWDTAFLTVQEGVDAATPGGEVWVADGVYVENVVMGEGVAIYGGFLGAEPGGYEDSLDQRDFVNNIATIDGNQSGSCVVMAPDARVDGFTITNGSGTPRGRRVCGGGIYCFNLGQTCAIVNNTITGHRSSDGAGIYCESSSPTITGNTITGNSVDFSGGGVCCLSSSPTITNNTISGNWSDEEGYGGGIYCLESSGTISDNTITENTVKYGGGMLYYLSSLTVTNNIISGNSGSYGGGGIYCSDSSGTISDNMITDNSAPDSWGGGGIFCFNQASPTITNNVLSGNFGADSGGGIRCSGGSFPTITNNTIADCTTDGYGGAISCWRSSPDVTNNIMVANAAGLEGGGIWCSENSSPSLAHNDFWQNSPDDYYGCDPGEGDISADPMFLDPGNGDYHLLPESPCIDAGWNDAPGLPEEDFEGDPRIIWAMRFPVPYWPHPGYVDIGADEYVPPGAIRRGWPGLRRLPAGQLPTDRGQIGGTPGR